MNVIETGTLVLTGANGGLGLKLSEAFLKSGNKKVAFQYRSNPTELKAVLERYDVDPSKHLFQADLTSEEQVRSFAKEVESKLGAVHSLVNLAGASSNGMSWKLSLEQFRSVIDANLTSTFLTCREFIPHMRAASFGRIINISSVTAFTGVAGASHYCAAKAGIVGFTKSLAVELANKNVTVNAIALGYFNHGMIQTVPADLQQKIKERIPAGRFGSADEAFGMLQYLLSSDASYTTGQVMHVNGGMYF